MFSKFVTRTLCSLIVGTILVGYGTSFAQLAFWM